MHGMPDTVRATPPRSPFDAAGIALTASSSVRDGDGDGDVLGAHAMTIGQLSLSSAISRARTLCRHYTNFFFFPPCPSSSSPSTQSQ